MVGDPPHVVAAAAAAAAAATEAAQPTVALRVRSSWDAVGAAAPLSVSRRWQLDHSNQPATHSCPRWPSTDSMRSSSFGVPAHRNVNAESRGTCGRVGRIRGRRGGPLASLRWCDRASGALKSLAI
eukprot:GHVU01212551.1.p1 GENE.GHVU01212551.1~~GHVU01212551.1.p1  ORF type:complete len:126 (+),score=12.43 GHVU01212551.1:69-446(+)